MLSDSSFNTPEVLAARTKLEKSLAEMDPEDREALREAAKAVTPERRKQIARETAEFAVRLQKVMRQWEVNHDHDDQSLRS